MAIIRTVNLSDFRQAFKTADRLTHFSYEGLESLFRWLEDVSDEDATPYELDVIGLCCEFAESSARQIADYYSIDISDCTEDDEIIETVLDFLHEHTCVVANNDGEIVYAQF